jgi:hypothetical protein
MTHITVPDDVARLILGATGPIVLVDSKGQTIVRVELPNSQKPSDSEVVAALQRMESSKSSGVFYTTSEVLQHLQATK